MRSCFIMFMVILGINNSYAKFISGIGYIGPEEYRVDNEINPLPFGLSLIPMIAYRGQRLQVYGPNISYVLLRGPVSFSLNAKAFGDRYKARDLSQRDTAVNAGVSLRLLFLTLKYGADISKVYNGNTAEVGIGWRFKFGDSWLVIPGLAKEYLNESYVNYYFGIDADEVGEFSFYEAKTAVNDKLRLGVTYLIDSENSLSLNYSYRKFDKVVYESPTISKEGYATWSFFWSYSL